MVAEGDIVVAHSLLRLTPEDRGTVVVGLLRLEGERIVVRRCSTNAADETSWPPYAPAMRELIGQRGGQANRNTPSTDPRRAV